ncbi:MAG: response regulator transcription factor [Desulfobacterales bacterium]|jgi:two-component system, OmpR family, alkaline phosphatase synthesis response regulator PhoP|nr:response regulator transcription factor [Desulfobacteraceae bacterium]MBT4365661.1 response regulator transcription factor [Desulfobacteraceae bacterium]MBT7084959.1 response regulator transcription factor [Desulfobacterales bacterium]MBT7696344.1 response regulator transcription factor [Desulfobacterales bacterium]
MTKSNKKLILLVEDDEHISEGLKLNLSLQGYNVDIASDGVSGLRMWKKLQPDLIVLDIMLPGLDGLSVLQSIRLEDERLPILILSAKNAPNDKIKGLAYGVDDYLSKPFNLEEFLLRVDRLLKRTSWSKEDISSEKPGIADKNQIYTFGDNRIDFSISTAYNRAGEINLTEQEVKLLKLFIANRGKPLSRNKLLRIGWGYSQGTSTRTVDNFIVRFRKYFEENSKKPKYFKSRRSVGYIFDHK